MNSFQSAFFRCLAPTLVVLLSMFAASCLVLTERAEAAVYWANGKTIAGANLDGSNLDLEYISRFASPDIAQACGVAVDGLYIYWGDRNLNRIGRANLDGTYPDFDFIVGAHEPCGLAVDSGHIYWANMGGDSIGRANLDGTAVQQEFIGGIRRPCGVAVRAPFIYWGSPTEESIGRSLAFADDMRDNRFVEGAIGACGVAINDAYLYWGSFGSTIGRADLDGSNPTSAFIAGLDRPCGVALDGSRLFWTEESIGNGGLIGAANLDGGEVNRRLVTGLGGPCGLAVDSRPFPLDRTAHLPFSEFSLAKVKHNRNRRNPTTFLAVDVPQAGFYSVGVPRGVGWNILGDEPYEGRFLRGGRKWLAVYLRGGRAAKQLARKLRRLGRIKLPITVRYTAVNDSIIDSTVSDYKADHRETTQRRTVALVGKRRK